MRARGDAGFLRASLGATAPTGTAAAWLAPALDASFVGVCSIAAASPARGCGAPFAARP